MGIRILDKVLRGGIFVLEFLDGLSVCGFPWDDEWVWEVIGKWEGYIDGTN
jgi:hypothetical protein